MRIAGLALGCVAMMTMPGTARAQAPLIAAASDLQFALAELARSFEQTTGKQVQLTFGSSGTFTTQIRSGAPFEMFVSADEDYVLKLHAGGLTRDQGVLYAIGRIAIVAAQDSPLAVDGELKGLAALLEQGRLTHFAIANPDHAPYGQRARQALQHAGLWDAVEPRLVLGENVSQAAQFATSGSAEGGIVALSLARSPLVAQRCRYALIPAQWHEPLRQRMVLLRNAGEAAEAFYRYLQTPEARTVLARYGFELPGGDAGSGSGGSGGSSSGSGGSAGSGGSGGSAGSSGSADSGREAK